MRDPIRWFKCKLKPPKKYPNLPPKALQVQCVKEKVSQGDIKGAQDIGRKLADRNRVRQLRSEMLSPDQNTDHHSMEAVAIFKEACDKSDPYHIFKMNDLRMNTLPDFVFKTSRLAAELGLLMDQEMRKRMFYNKKTAILMGLIPDAEDSFP